MTHAVKTHLIDEDVRDAVEVALAHLQHAQQHAGGHEQQPGGGALLHLQSAQVRTNVVAKNNQFRMGTRRGLSCTDLMWYPVDWPTGSTLSFAMRSDTW